MTASDTSVRVVRRSADEITVAHGDRTTGRTATARRALARLVPGRPSTSRVLAAVGRLLVILSVVALASAAYGVVVSGWIQHRDQSHLQASFTKVVTLARSGGATTGGFFSARHAPKTAPPRSAAVALLAIPALHLEQAVLGGASAQHLTEGPALFAGPQPGAAGDVVIGGHRTLAGGPFYRLDRLQRGDAIVVTTAKGRFTYTVITTGVVGPDQRSALGNFGDSRLTLTSGDPIFSESHPLIVEALLTSSTRWPSAATPSATPAKGGPAAPEVPGDSAAWGLVVLGALVAILAALAPGAIRKRWPRHGDPRAAWAVAGPVALAGAYVGFHALVLLMPATI